MAQSKPISISLLLKDEARNPQAIERVREIASKLGFTPSTSGLATMSLKLSPDQFESVFGVRPDPLEKLATSTGDYGRAAGYREIENLPIPNELSAYVQLMSVEPPATRHHNDQP